jgi:hypothetical protein
MRDDVYPLRARERLIRFGRPDWRDPRAGAGITRRTQAAPQPPPRPNAHRRAQHQQRQQSLAEASGLSHRAARRGRLSPGQLGTARDSRLGAVTPSMHRYLSCLKRRSNLNESKATARDGVTQNQCNGYRLCTRPQRPKQGNSSTESQPHSPGWMSSTVAIMRI